MLTLKGITQYSSTVYIGIAVGVPALYQEIPVFYFLLQSIHLW